MSKTIRKHARIKGDCEYCLHRTRKCKRRGCDRSACCFEDVRAYAALHGRIIREGGQNQWQ
jgi:hypothetical protein